METVDPLQAQLAAQQKEQQTDPLDLHAQFFYMYSPRLRNQLNMINKKGLIRLLFSLIQFPLNEKEIKLRSKVEQDAFQTADQMLTSKYVMMIVTDMQTQMEKENKKVDNNEPVVDNVKNEGENNG